VSNRVIASGSPPIPSAAVSVVERRVRLPRVDLERRERGF
jgi:hypothetical protein